MVTFSSEGKVISYDTSAEELITKNEQKKIDGNKVVESITTLVTVVLPAVLVYLSIN